MAPRPGGDGFELHASLFSNAPPEMLSLRTKQMFLCFGRRSEVHVRYGEEFLWRHGPNAKAFGPSRLMRQVLSGSVSVRFRMCQVQMCQVQAV